MSKPIRPSTVFNESHERCFDPLVGEYIRTSRGFWHADSDLTGLQYSIHLRAPGPKPTPEQISKFSKVISLLPEIISKSGLNDVPSIFMQPTHCPTYQLLTAKIENIFVNEDGSIDIMLEGIYNINDIYLSPFFKVLSDFQPIVSDWIV